MPKSISSWWSEPSPALRYGIASLAAAAAIAAALLLDTFLQTSPFVSLFLCAIMFVAWFGGVGPGLLATALSILAFDYFLLPPTYSFALIFKDIPRLVLFVIAALFVVALSAAQRGTAESLRHTRDDLEDKVHELERVNEALRNESAERKRADEKIRKAERELQATIDTIPALVASYSPDGTRDFINKPGLDYTGLAPEDLKSNRWQFVVHPDDLQDLQLAESKWRAGLEKGEPFQSEFRIRRADGEFRWHMSRRVPLRDDQGNVIKWYGVGFDIEDQKRAENALRRSEADLAEARRELQLTIDMIPALVANYRPDGSRDSVNQTWRNYTGLSLDEAKGQSWSIIAHPDDAESSENEWRVCLATGKPFHMAHRLRRADGEYRWHMVDRVPLRDENGDIVKWYAAGFDIEDQKRAEDALRRSEADLAEAKRQLQLTIDTIPALAATHRPDGTMDFVNQTWRNYTGLAQESVQGRRWGAAIHPDDFEFVEKEWRAHVATGEPFQTEHRIRRADGDYRRHLVRRVSLRDDAGDVVRWYAVGIDIEDRKRAEDALRRSEADLAKAKRELQLTIDTIPALASRYRTDGTTDFVNQTWRSYTGLPQESWSGRGSAVVHPDDRRRVEQAWAAHLAAAEPFDVEQRMRRADGEYRWYFVRRVPLRDDSGNVIAWYGAGYDIEDRKRAEFALHAREADLATAERELRLTLDSIPTLAWRTRTDGFAEYLNKPWLDYTGLSLEESLGWNWQVAIHPEDHPGLLDRWREILAAGKPAEVEARMRRFDGAYRWFLFRPEPLLDESGNVVRWYGTNTDIEDRKQAEDALRRSEAYLDEAQRLSQTGSFGWKIASGDMVWSKETYQIMGVDQAIEPTMDIVIQRAHPDDRAIVREQIDRAVQGEHDYDYEHRLLMPDGSVKHLHVRAHRAKYESGEDEIVGALVDVTDTRRAQEALHVAQAELAHVSRVTTLGEISASIAHEVNQPLAAIVANGEACLRWLNRGTPNLDEVRVAMEWIIKDGNRASEVIQRVRALSNKADTQKVPLDVNDVVNEVIALLRRELFRHRVLLRRELAPALPMVLADRVQLQQVIINLVMNSIEAMQPVTDRRREMVIRTHRDEMDQVLVTVKDSGVGISTEHADRLFNAFFTTKSGGMGIGLSICRSIIEAHEGRLSAIGDAGLGATFQFSLPPYQAEAA